MEQHTRSPLPSEPTAADYDALIDRIYAVGRAYCAGEIDFAALQQAVRQIEQETRRLDLLRKLCRTAAAIRQEQERTHPAK